MKIDASLAESKMLLDLNIVVTHQGEVGAVTQANVTQAIRAVLGELIVDDVAADEEDMGNVVIRIYCKNFEYSDNLAALRSRISEKLEGVDSDLLNTIMELINNE